MAALIQGLRIVYNEHKYTANGTVRNDVTACEYLLTNNYDITLLCHAYRGHPARYGHLSVKANPITRKYGS